MTPRRVNYYCAGGRIPGAVKMAGVWLLPKTAEKPLDGRTKQGGAESNKKLAKQRERIGCIIESPSLYLDMTAYENLEVQRLQRGIPGKGCIDNALALVGLKDTGKEKSKRFLFGYAAETSSRNRFAWESSNSPY